MIYHSQPTISGKEVKAVKEVLKSGYLSQSKWVIRFEETLAKYVGVKYGIATNSGTSALHLALLALGIKKGDEVILPSYVCSAVLNAVNYTQAKPILTDINESDFNISLADTKRKITKRTKAIIVPHIFGYPADIKGFLSLGIPIIEDCAHSIGATYNDKRLGSFGDLAIFSFYATKMLTTGYGGMITTNNKRFAERIRNWRDFDNRADYIIRYNYQLSDLQGALGLSQLKQLPYFLKRRKEIAYAYNKQFYCLNDKLLYKQTAGPKTAPSYYRYVIGIKNPPEFIRQMQKNQVEVKGPIYKPLHRYLGLPRQDFPVTEKVYETTVSLPIYPGLTDKQVNYIIKLTKPRLMSGQRE
jgi:perosamine synthetase